MRRIRDYDRLATLALLKRRLDRANEAVRLATQRRDIIAQEIADTGFPA